MKHRTLASAVAVICGVGLPVLSAQQRPGNDAYFRLAQSNKAQIVMLAEEGLIPKPLAGRIAAGMKRVLAEAEKPGASRSGNYLDFEEKLVEVVGPEASSLHMGRSRIDLGTTSERSSLREATFAVLDKMIAARGKLIELASKHINTVLPGYTNGVQAQPTTLAHYLLAFASVFERDDERLRQAHARINKSTLGSAAFATSGFPLDRDRVAELLGFQGIVENSYDATGLSTFDSKADFANSLALSAVTLGRLAQYLLIQYANPQPGLMLPAERTGRSSIMPQKRNPGEIERLRYVSGEVAGGAQTVWMVAHNTTSGDVDDLRATLLRHTLQVGEDAGRMYDTLGRILDDLVVRPEITLAIVDSDYSTMTELADTLLREANVPFRVGHHFASELTTYGREHRKTPKELNYEEVAKIYQDTTATKFPLSAEQLRNALSPEHIVANRRGKGGPQPAEVKRMLAAHRQHLEGSKTWVASERKRISDAYAKLENAFNALAQNN